MSPRTRAMTAVVLALATSSSRADFGRFFQDGNKLDPARTFADAAPTKFDGGVTDGGKSVGSIKFDYDPYVFGADPKTATQGGAALSGGFYIDADFKVAPGETLAWVQTIIATLTTDDGISLFKLPDMNAGRYPDADPKNRQPDAQNRPKDPLFAPSYTFVTTNLDPPKGVPAPTVGYQDFPSLEFSDNAKIDRSFVAQLGLVCFDNKPGNDGVTQAHVITSFLWGFSIAANATSITPNAPSFLGPPTPGYVNTLNAFYSTGTSPAPGKVATDKYSFTIDDGGCFAAVPEPRSALLLAAGLGLAFCRRLTRPRRPDERVGHDQALTIFSRPSTIPRVAFLVSTTNCEFVTMNVQS